jgi:A/G-specific adenine glycosylase
MTFSAALIAWYNNARRDLPWRKTAHPYRILVSEVMLQQTRVATVIPYYERFLAKYPDAAALAAAPEQELLALWAGLGYYSRARNLQRAAQLIADRGEFPSTFAEIRELPGVGDYTAAAIASISFGLPHAVLDGNVLRVMARVQNDAGDIRSAVTRKRMQAAVDARLDRKRPALFNQAVMELGATLCLPRKPQCLLCPVGSYCEGRKAGRQNDLPVKLRPQRTVEEERHFLVIQKNGAVLLRQRAERESRLAGFWELPEQSELPSARVGRKHAEFRHAITVHKYRCRVSVATLGRVPQGFRWIPLGELRNIPLSTMARKALASID